MVIHARNFVTSDDALGGSLIEKSLRVDIGVSNVSSGSFFDRTFADGNKRTFTISVWFKKCNLVGRTVGEDSFTIISCGGGGTGSYAGRFGFDSYSADQLQFVINNPAPTQHARARSTRRFRDDAWYHAVLAYDSTQSTESDRMKMYINGELETMDSPTYPSQNYEGYFNNNVLHRVGSTSSWSTGQDLGQFNGNLAEFHFIDGTTYDASYFGYTEQQTGIWRPKRVSGLSYGTTGFYLDFKDTTSDTTIGYDKSGNANNFTPHDVVVSDVVEDSPTNNWCILSSFLTDTRSDSDFRKANLTVTTGSGASTVGGNFPQTTGKWYAEFVCTAKSSTNMMIGVNSVEGFDGERQNNESQNGGKGYGYINNGNKALPDGSNPSYGASWAIDDVMGIALDLDNNQVNFYKNNAAQGVISIDDGYSYVMSCGHGQGGVTATFDANFGQRAFTYTPPTGYKTLNSANLSPNVPSIVRPQRHFDIKLYTGNSSTQKITGLEFKPDMIWFKSRTSTSTNGIADSVRGRSKLLYPDTNQTEQTSSTTRDLVSFDHGGFTLGNPQNLGSTNLNGLSIVTWCWKAGGAAVSNSDGSITSSVSANTEAGFSIVSFTGNGTSGATVGHGLNDTPRWILVKERTTNSNNWAVYHASLGNTRAMYMDITNDQGGDFTGGWNNTSPTSSVFSLGDSVETNRSSGSFMAYCWAEVPGFSKFGSYEGNNSTDGPYIHLGFRPAWVMIKNADAGSTEWYILDSARDTDNPVGQYLSASSEAAEATYVFYDFLSDGFKLRNTGSAQNPSSQTIIYMAFAEQPGPTPFDTFANSR